MTHDTKIIGNNKYNQLRSSHSYKSNIGTTKSILHYIIDKYDQIN